MNATTSATTEDLMIELGRNARAAARVLAQSPSEAKNRALAAAAAAVRAGRQSILAANAQDMAAAQSKGLAKALLDRLMLDDKRVEAMAKGLEEVALLPDPVGQEMARWMRPNGLDIARVRVPLGVIGIIYESRPNVTADAGALCLKSGTAAILRGGSDSTRSSRAIHAAIQQGLREAGLPEACIQLVPTRDRAAVGREIVGAQPLLSQDDRVGRQAAHILDEARQVVGDLRIGRLIVGVGRCDRLRLAELVDLHDPRRDGAARRLPHQASGEQARKDQRPEGHEPPILGLDAGRTDPLVPDLGGLLVGRLRLWGAPVAHRWSSEHAHSPSERSTDAPPPPPSPDLTA